ncbi:uncharacterized protein [Apostichopus japonicus]|uniref:uncharacterized protein n=1 Tax=Stichopus japonicus TaxID=307972 RepID=UPI003AB37E91
MLTVMDGNLDPFAEFMWMEEQDAFDLKVIEELIEEEQIQEDFDDMMAEEEEHYNNSIQILPYEEEIDTELPDEEPSRSQTDDYDSVQTQQDETSTVIPETTNNVPWSNETNEISTDISSDSDSEGGGPQR